MSKEPKSSKGPRRNIIDHKKMVGEARIRRKTKEKENQRLMKHNGVAKMQLQQEDLLAGLYTTATPLGIYVSNARIDHMNVMHSIIVEIDKVAIHADVETLFNEQL